LESSLIPKSESGAVLLSLAFVSPNNSIDEEQGARKEAVLNHGVTASIDLIARGRMGEQIAASFLADRGYHVLARNQHTPLGEIDLICRDRLEVVIVEVKARSGGTYGSALEAIGPLKARRLRGSATWWLSSQGLFPCPMRFDAVVVDLDGQGLPCCVQHVKDLLGA
jgi:putative endonuclease